MPRTHRSVRCALASGAVAALLGVAGCDGGVEDPPAGPPVTEDPADEGS